jgi:chromosome segregation ATPase
MIRRLAIWFLRAWPVLAMALIGCAHVFAITQFPSETVFVNKLTGTFLQIVGGLIVLHSVDANLGLFRNHSLATAVVAWLRECPIFVRNVTISGSGAAACAASGSATVTVTRAATTIEERVAEVERRLDELRSEVTAQNSAIHTRIEEVKSELSSSISSNQAALNKLSEQVEKATVGGFKQQAFGVMLVIYGATTSVFA